MSRLEELHEFRFVNAITAGLPRSPWQVNTIHGADAELIRLPGGDHLAVTIDGLYEEYKVGLLRDPEALGWAMVAHSLSDLAAVAAEPLGVLLSLTLPRGCEPEWARALNRGAAAALEAHGTFCLGGDTSFAEEASFQCCAVGRVERDRYLTRLGARSGDRIYLTGPAGTGNLLGISLRISEETWRECEALYRPRARLGAARSAREHVVAAIDTSDGLMAGLDLLARLNGLGVHVESRDEIWHPRLRELSAAADFPLWIGGAFGMGEYELLLVVREEEVEHFEMSMSLAGHDAVPVGHFTRQPGMTMRVHGGVRAVDATRLLNMFAELGSLEAYVDGLLAFDAELREAPVVEVPWGEA